MKLTFSIHDTNPIVLNDLQKLFAAECDSNNILLELPKHEQYLIDSTLYIHHSQTLQHLLQVIPYLTQTKNIVLRMSDEEFKTQPSILIVPPCVEYLVCQNTNINRIIIPHNNNLLECEFVNNPALIDVENIQTVPEIKSYRNNKLIEYNNTKIIKEKSRQLEDVSGHPASMSKTTSKRVAEETQKISNELSHLSNDKEKFAHLYTRCLKYWPQPKDPNSWTVKDHSLATALLYGGGVCEAQAKAFAALCQAVGLDVRAVSCKLETDINKITSDIYIGLENDALNRPVLVQPNHEIIAWTHEGNTLYFDVLNETYDNILSGAYERSFMCKEEFQNKNAEYSLEPAERLYHSAKPKYLLHEEIQNAIAFYDLHDKEIRKHIAKVAFRNNLPKQNETVIEGGIKSIDQICPVVSKAIDEPEEAIAYIGDDGCVYIDESKLPEEKVETTQNIKEESVSDPSKDEIHYDDFEER